MIGTSVLVVLFVAGTPLWRMAGLGLVAGAATTALALGAGYRRDRVLAFLDPWDDPLNTGYQTIQSLVGIAVGGLFGVGLGASRAKWGFLPFAHTDFIFAIIAEELGLIGAGAVVVLFVALGVFGARAALRRTGPLRHAAGGGHHDLAGRAGRGQHRRGARRAADHRRDAAVRLLRWLVAGRHAWSRRASCSTSPGRASSTWADDATASVIAGGGTAGHTLPGLAIAEALVAGAGRPATIHFVGSRSGESRPVWCPRPGSSSPCCPGGASSAG